MQTTHQIREWSKEFGATEDILGTPVAQARNQTPALNAIAGTKEGDRDYWPASRPDSLGSRSM